MPGSHICMSNGVLTTMMSLCIPRTPTRIPSHSLVNAHWFMGAGTGVNTQESAPAGRHSKETTKVSGGERTIERCNSESVIV